MARDRKGRFASADADLLADIRDTIDHDTSAWQETRDEANKDMQCVAGEPWQALDPLGFQQRQTNNRPALALDELNQYLNQATNDWLLNPRAIQYDPVGNGANDRTAQLYADLTREIEYRSHAQEAYSTAFRDMIQRSYGWVRIRAERESSRSFNKVLRIDAVPNPDMIIPDADAQLPDQSDGTHLTVARDFSHAEYRRKFPKAKIKSFGGDDMELAPQWIKDDTVRVVEHWRIETRPRVLLMLPDGTTLFEDELTELMKGSDAKRKPRIVQREEVDDPFVMSYLTNGLELLEKKEWPGKYIPFAACFGQILYYDSGAGITRRLMSMTRLARDPYMLYCYYRSTEAELVGMTPKFPYFVYEGQLSPTNMKLLADSLHQPVSVIQVKPTLDLGGASSTQLVPFPQRNPYEPPIGPLELGAEAARRAIQAAMGITPMPTPAQRNNEKTGAAFERIESSMQKGTFHFMTHGEHMVRRVGVILEDGIEQFYDSVRTVGLINALGKASRAQINVPGGVNQTKGDHAVTVSAGPDYESSRERANDIINGFVRTPGLAQAIGPQKYTKALALAIRVMNAGPIMDELANLLDPQQGNDPAQLAQENQTLKGQLQQIGAALQKAMTDLNTDAVKTKGRITEKQIEAQNAVTLQTMKDATTLAVAKINALTKGVIAENESRDELMALASDQVHELRMAEMDRRHESGETLQARRHDVVRAIQDHAHAIDQAATEHKLALDRLAQGGGNGQPPAGS